MTCPCKKECSSSNPSQALQITKCEPPVLFHKVQYPASLGNDTEVPPESLDYRNVLLTYEANNHSYLYSSDGIPTLISMGELDVEEIKAQIAALGGQLAEETTNREDGDAELSAKIESNVIAIEQNAAAIQTQQASLAELQQSQEEGFNQLNSAISGLEDTVVQKDTKVSGDASTVTLTKTTGALESESNLDTALPLPVASEAAAGVMNSATYNAIQENSENIDSILGGAVVVSDLPAEPTQAELTAQWKAETGKTTLINRASIYDEANKLVWYYYENANEWKSMPAGDAAVSVSIATNDTPGIVKGSTEDGQVAVEADGSMSLNGYDGMQHDIENLSQLVAGIEVPKLRDYVFSFNTPRDNIVSQKPNSVTLAFPVVNTTSGSATQAVENISSATPSVAGVMAAADKSKLNSLLEIKSLNDSLSLDENGQLSVVGGGSDVNLLSTYTATVGDNDAYNAGYVNDRLDGASVILGSWSHAFSRLGQAGDIIVGTDALTSGIGSNKITIGNYSQARGYGSIAIGPSAYAYNAAQAQTVNDAVAIGASSLAGGMNSVALGAYSYTLRDNTVSIGTGGNPGDNPYVTRYLANVTAGELPTDAVNLQQMQDYVAEHAGGGSALFGKTAVVGTDTSGNIGFRTIYPTYIRYSFPKFDMTTGATLQDTYINVPSATSTQVGLMPSADKSKLDSLLEIKSLNDSLELDENGQLSVVGGGGSAKLYDTYGTNTDGALTQAFVSEKLNGNYVNIGSNTSFIDPTVSEGDPYYGVLIGYKAQDQGSPAESTPSSTYGIAIGYNTKIVSSANTGGTTGIAIGSSATAAAYHNIAIGSNAQSTERQGIAIGSSASTQATGAIAIGEGAQASNARSVAIGMGSKTDANYVVSFGDPDATNESYKSRILRNVRAGTNDLDAVNVAQARAAVQGTVLYEGAASVNTLELAEAATNFDHIRIVAEYTSTGSSAMEQSLSVDFYPTATAKSFQMTATDITVGDTPMLTTYQDIWMLSEDGMDLDIVSSSKAEQGNGTLVTTPDTTSQFTITKVIGYGKI